MCQNNSLRIKKELASGLNFSAKLLFSGDF